MSKWETVRLGDVATYINGYAFKPSDWSDTGLPIIRIQNLTGNDYETNYYSGEYNKKYEVKNGDILISWSASLGIYEWKKETALLNQHIFKVQFDKLMVDKSYFIHTVSYLLDDMIKETHGSTMKHITKPKFDNTLFPYPPVEEQKKIASTLDKVTHTIDLCNQIIEKLDLLVKAKFVEMFGDLYINPYGWKFEKLSELCDVRDGTHDSPKYVDKGYPLMTSKNFTNGYVDFSEVSLISEKDFATINKRSKVDFGDIIMPMIGTIGHPVIIETSRPFAIKNVALIKFSDENISNVFIKYVLDSEYFKIKAEEKNRGNTQKFIALGDIRNLLIPIVPLSLQNKFATFVEQKDKSKLAVKQVLEKAETLKKALMQEYFG
ncbi:MAG: restriction endonuclease subunit S [Oscillospiraceae bacterium]|nr:restriction endonuclease subunit S [Oscillospiraceae bacterium]